ncbi:MAG: HupE/UreJ family protein [Pirellulales bacterium]
MTRKTLGAVLLLLVAFVGPAFAHPNHADHAFSDGFAHPWFGVDHLAAMLGVGLLAARLGGRGLWLGPAAFLGAMTLGAVASWGDGSLAQTAWWGELGVMFSVAVYGLLLARKQTTSLAVCLLLVATFALFHGYAHAAEANGAAVAPYLVGMVSATAALHATGIAAGVGLMRLANGQVNGDRLVRTSGAAIAALGIMLLAGQLI